MNIDDLCMGCMNELFGEEKCPNCGFYANTPQISPYLPLKSHIGDRYIIGKMISANSEGATYMGYDSVRNSPVTVREFLPEQFVTRRIDSPSLFVNEGCEELFQKYLGKFLDMWRKLARLRGLSALVPVVDIIESNNTAYVISEHIESITLREFLLKSQTGYLNWSKAKVLFMPVLSALLSIHGVGIIHGGINPDSLLIGRDGKLHLTGFSINEAHLENSDLTPEFFDGYTPLEQYGYNYNFGTWSDIYSFSAVIYRSLVGTVPQDAVSRSVNDQLIIPARYAEIIPIYVINALMNGMQIEPDDRTLDAETLREELSATPGNVVSSFSGSSVPPKPAQPEKTQPSVPEPEESSTAKTVLITFLIILITGLLAFGGYLTYEHFFADKPETEQEDIAQDVKTFVVEDFRYGTASQNLTYNQIINSQQKRFNITVTEEYSSTVPENYIIEQSVAPGKEVPYGTDLVLTVSRGKEYVRIPDVMDYNVDRAKTTLEEAGFVVSVIEDENDGTHEENSVCQITPNAGENAEKGSTVCIHVYGQPPETEPESESETESETSFLGGLVGRLPDISDILSGG
ncbi:MAG: PASTA domain-containing protein [Oscillospiraceae bacterium]|nr:PASTA domain-containing protein [Oscillospiraceae bacterium]